MSALMTTAKGTKPVARKFELFQHVRKHRIISLVVGILALCGAAAGFAFVVATSAGTMIMTLVATMPTVLGIGALINAWKLSRSPLSVTVTPHELFIVRKRDEQTIPWEAIGWANLQDIPLSSHKQLIVYDIAGKVLVKLTDALTDFKLLVDLIQLKVASRNDSTADEIRRRKSRRTGALFIALGVLLLVGSVFLLIDARDKQRAEQRLTEAGVQGEAEIVERFMAPNGVTSRLRYHIAGPNGYSKIHNVEISRAYWEVLAGATKVPVIYVPDEPDISRLQMGEVAEKDFTDKPAGRYFMVIALFAISLFFIGGGAMTFSGWDIKFDSDTRKFSVKRFGS